MDMSKEGGRGQRRLDDSDGSNGTTSSSSESFDSRWAMLRLLDFLGFPEAAASIYISSRQFSIRVLGCE